MLKEVVVQLSGGLKWRSWTLEALPQALETRSSFCIFTPVHSTHDKALWRPRKDHRLSLRKNNINVFDHV
jgi:hypothetical protein